MTQMLTVNGVPEATRGKLALLFVEILKVYPLGHGYFSGLLGDVPPAQLISYYKTRVRPVLTSFLGELKHAELAKVDNLVDELFGSG